MTTCINDIHHRFIITVACWLAVHLAVAQIEWIGNEDHPSFGRIYCRFESYLELHTEFNSLTNLILVDTAQIVTTDTVRHVQLHIRAQSMGKPYTYDSTYYDYRTSRILRQVEYEYGRRRRELEYSYLKDRIEVFQVDGKVTRLLTSYDFVNEQLRTSKVFTAAGKLSAMTLYCASLDEAIDLPEVTDAVVATMNANGVRRIEFHHRNEAGDFELDNAVLEFIVGQGSVGRLKLSGDAVRAFEVIEFGKDGCQCSQVSYMNGKVISDALHIPSNPRSGIRARP